MKRAVKLGEAAINGKQVSFFSPPHDEPDMPWVDHYELLCAFVPKKDAKALVEKTRRFKDGAFVSVTARNGSRLVSIIPHAIAQGLLGALDDVNGDTAEDGSWPEGGPRYSAYCLAAGVFGADNWPLSFEDMIHAFRNPGGPILRAADV